MRAQRGESVLTRAVRILDAFRPEETSLTVSEIAARGVTRALAGPSGAAENPLTE